MGSGLFRATSAKRCGPHCERWAGDFPEHRRQSGSGIRIARRNRGSMLVRTQRPGPHLTGLESPFDVLTALSLVP